MRFDFTAFFGYRTSMSFPVEPHFAGTNSRVVVDASPSYGVSFGVRSREEDLIEVRGQGKTHMSMLRRLLPNLLVNIWFLIRSTETLAMNPLWRNRPHGLNHSCWRVWKPHMFPAT
jgi:hypothetical protein